MITIQPDSSFRTGLTNLCIRSHESTEEIAYNYFNRLYSSPFTLPGETIQVALDSGHQNTSFITSNFIADVFSQSDTSGAT